MNNQLLDLMKVALGRRDRMIVAPSDDDWLFLMNECNRQSVVGIAWEGIERLPKEQRPNRSIYGQWYMLVKEVEEKSRKAEVDAEEMEKEFYADNLPCCILKGQGVAHLYPNPYHRQSGDIDLWVSGGRKKVIRYVRDRLGRKDVEARVHHVQFPFYKDKKIEVHYLPIYMYSAIAHKKLVKFFKREMPEQMQNMVEPRPDVPGTTTFHTPTPTFNAVFMLTHILRHLLEEGIGLRQLIDYYYVLRALPRNADDSGIEENTRLAILKDVKKLGLEQFMRCMMYVMREALGMEEKYLICEYDSTDGRIFLAEIMYTGNFGFYDPRNLPWKKANKTRLFFGKLSHNMRLWHLCPKEIASGPFFRIWHHLWRSSHHYFVADSLRKN